MSDLYDTGFVRWTEQQAQSPRRRAESANNDELDYLNLAEEIESVGVSQKREVRSRLALIFQHLMEWHYQPDLRSRSWENTLRVERRNLLVVFEDSPSLRGFAERIMSAARAQRPVRSTSSTSARGRSIRCSIRFPARLMSDNPSLALIRQKLDHLIQHNASCRDDIRAQTAILSCIETTLAALLTEVSGATE